MLAHLQVTALRQLCLPVGLNMPGLPALGRDQRPHQVRVQGVRANMHQCHSVLTSCHIALGSLLVQAVQRQLVVVAQGAGELHAERG